MADNKPSNRERIKEIVTGIEAGIQDLFQSDKFADYLRTMSRFHNYSYNNTILIHMQMPSATHVAGFNKWKNQFGRHVKKGEKGLTIIAPTPFKKRIEEMKLDPDTRAPVLDHDGNVIMEEREIEIPLFRPVKVFDVSQTEGRPLPSLVAPLTGDVQQYEAFMEALRRTSPVPVQFKPLREGLDGFLNLEDQTITIREGMSQVQTVCAAVHEITHAMLHNREQERLSAAAGTEQAEKLKPKDQNTKEVEAESVSYTVCQYYGIETSANSLGYIATWSKDKSLPELKASLETISKTANILITSIDRHFQDICKEQGIDLTAQQPEQDAPSAAPDTLEQFAADLYDFMDQLHQEGVLKHPFTQDPREQSIADLVIEMRKGYFEGVRSPLNYLIEHTDLILTDLTKAKTLLARLDGLVQTQDAPAAELPPDTPERFISDMLDMLDHLYQAGLIKKNFPPDNREQTKANLVRTLQVNPSIVRATLEQFIQQDTGAAEAKVMLERLDGLAQSVPLKEYVYKMEANPRTVGAIDQQFIQAYERTAQGTLKPDRVLFFGTADKCAGILKKLQSGELKPDDFFQPGTARISHYKTKDGAELDAFVGPDDKVYMGRRDHYDNRGHYLNADKSLLYLSDNTVMFDFVSGSSYAATQAELLAQGCFTMEDYAEFDALRVGVLAQFEQVGQLLFAGEPFSFTQPDTAEVEQQPPPAPEPLAQADEALRDTTLDEYPLPDPAFSADEMEQDYGYSGGDLLPLSRERAAELLEQDLTVYMVEAGENPAMVFDRDDLMEQPEGMMFAVTREEWEESQDFRQAVLDRMQHQPERERAFLDHVADCFAIYQVRDDDALRDIRFESLDWLKSKGCTVERDNYDLVYTAPLSTFASADAALDQLWYQFNNDHPADFQHPSISVSDIIVLKRDGVVSCHYCDSFGFEQLTDFISQKPTVAELEAQVKAGQTISLTDLADAVHREKKKSVVAQLKNQPAQERKKTAPKKSAEKER
ncbi:YodL domain-containing protein [Colidextribacter sp. OB.20]|uniref:YodL domain-containing protein n=1 Tax=Colidextribacter sp. OB.20 TaxID=2304568 RepID=UPI00325FC687